MTSFDLVSPIILPTPMKMLKDMIFVGQNLLTSGYVLTSLWTTIKEVIYGFARVIAFGFSLGVLVGETTFGEKAVVPYLVAIDTMPKVDFAPLFCRVAELRHRIQSRTCRTHRNLSNRCWNRRGASRRR